MISDFLKDEHELWLAVVPVCAPGIFVPGPQPNPRAAARRGRKLFSEIRLCCLTAIKGMGAMTRGVEVRVGSDDIPDTATCAVALRARAFLERLGGGGEGQPEEGQEEPEDRREEEESRGRSRSEDMKNSFSRCIVLGI